MLYRTAEWYSLALLRANPDVTFVFGDNCQRYGKGGQAVVRDEPNAMGLATKWAPDTSDLDYFDDEDWEFIGADLMKVLVHSLDHDVVIPFSDRVELGTGLSQLPERAPRLYAALSLVFTEALPVWEQPNA